MNTSSRMESTGEPCKLQASEATKQMIEQHFKHSDIGAKERGVVNVKGKGDMRTYWVVKDA